MHCVAIQRSSVLKSNAKIEIRIGNLLDHDLNGKVSHFGILALVFCVIQNISLYHM